MLLMLLAVGAQAATVTRGPYLQLADERGVTVVFRTDAPGVGAVRYGASSGALDARAADEAPTREHAIRLSGLSSATRYAYALELDGAPLASGPDFTFRTYPPKGSPEPFRFFAWGDSGDGSTRQLRTAARMASQVGEPAFSLILGDIIYPAGEAEGYDPYYFQPYAPLLRREVVWPTLGNHDAMTGNGQPYVDAFHLPANNPEHSELYYSFDYGDAHFLSLATDAIGYGPGSPQLQWAAEDLARSRATWKFAFFHRPPYSGGTHTGDRLGQAAIVPVLEAAGVDAVFCGHSHVYERTYLLQNGVVLQSDKASYTKLPGSPGTLYVVSGAGGESGFLHNPFHPLMAAQEGDTNGTLVVDVAGPVARGYFLHPDGSTLDLFTLYKGRDADAPRPIGVRAGPGATHVTLSFDEPVSAGAGPGGAENPASYTVSPSLPVTEAKLGPDLRTVTLTTGAHQAGAYALSLHDVQDRASPPNPVARVELLYAYDPRAEPAVLTREDSPAPAPSSTGRWPLAVLFVMVPGLAALLLFRVLRARRRKTP